ncbi:hypothetical protein F3N42_08800 [Marinihelvus fidelis]|uniref:Chorismatase FkbO/Hyg5-like N-terminal domain-containing protein n=2 Tax=Marinihelvus fidelis TaxID=2613842 RepID=A0A5N0TDN7_9GAMM|nr:hypothetical protein F3N42_08800 [Marinihelvus fidelis]
MSFALDDASPGTEFARFDFRPGARPGDGVFTVDMAHLAGPRIESWTSADAGNLLFVELRAAPGEDIMAAAERLYRELFRHLDERGFRHIIKAWNHVPDINHGEGDDEIYKRFCLGRARAIDAAYADRPMPAGTGVGFSADAGLQVQALASREAPLYIENPRQVSAFEYPRQYGPRSPSFSRAVVAGPGRDRLFVSGTAAIVGHQSKHADCLVSQVEETLRNWQSLFAACTTATGLKAGFDQGGAYRVYLRHADDLDDCLAALARGGVPLEKTTVLRADICRPELLFELDGVVALT